MIDLRSDTVTRPTPGMLDAMFSASVGDDVFGEDPGVTALENRAAELFGMEAGLFCPSGTMTNQIALNILTQPYQEIICYKGSHVYVYEGGGLAGNSGLSLKLLDAPGGILSRELVAGAINPDDIHFPESAVVSLENTVNKGGGSCYPINTVLEISEYARAQGLRLHLDGARIFNALVARNESAADYGECFDTISVCLSKGLGAPVGSVLLSSDVLIKKARRMRKVFGGGMRQAGYLAAAGLYALDNNIDRLSEDHFRARVLADTLADCAGVAAVIPPETNIVIFELTDNVDAAKYLEQLKERGLLAVSFGGQLIRLVTHLDFGDEALEQAKEILIKLDPFSA